MADETNRQQVDAVSAVNPDLSVATNKEPSSSTQVREVIWSDDSAFDTMRRLMEINGVIFCPEKCDQKLLSGILGCRALRVRFKGDKGFWRCTDYQYASLRSMVVEICGVYAEMNATDLAPFSSWPEVEMYYNRWFRNCLRVRAHDRLPKKHEHMFINECLGHRTLGDPEQKAVSQGRNPILTTKAKAANEETMNVILDPKSQKHIPELEYDCAGRMVTPFIIPPGKRYWSQRPVCIIVAMHDDKSKGWSNYMCFGCCAWPGSLGEPWCGIMPDKYAVHPERDLIEQSLLTMESEIVTHLADVTGLPRNQRCREHTNHDHPYECTECANVLEAVNAMLENNKDQIMRCKNCAPRAQW